MNDELGSIPSAKEPARQEARHRRALARKRLAVGWCVALALAPSWSAAQSAPAPGTGTPPVNRITGAAPDANWEEDYACAVGTTAYVHLFSWLYFSQVRWLWATKGMAGMSTPLIVPNVLSHQRQPTDARYKDGGRPTVDSTYSATWVDLSREPMILTVPDMGERYFSVQMVGFNADNFDYVSKRTTGTRAGVYAIVGPHWKGTLPEGVKALAPSPTPWAFSLIRIEVRGTADLPAVARLQDQIKLEHLSVYLGKPSETPKYVLVPPVARQKDPLADWKNINRALAESPVPAYEAQLAKMYAQVGIGGGLDVETMSDAVKRGLARAAKLGAAIVTSGPPNNVGRKVVNGWGMTPPYWGRETIDGHYLIHAAKTLGGFVVHDPQESIYPGTFVDDRGEQLNDSRRYELRFEKGQTPPVNAFWSVTLYGPDYNLVDNPINRYAVSDRTPGVKYGADGSLTLYIQKDAPSDDRKGNWLPSNHGNFHLVLRTYLPKAEMIEGKWKPPVVRRVE